MFGNRFETTYNRDFCNTFKNLSVTDDEFQKSSKLNTHDYFDSGISSEDEEFVSLRRSKSHYNIPECDQSCEKQRSIPNRASNFEYIHHINPTEHDARYKHKIKHKRYHINTFI